MLAEPMTMLTDYALAGVTAYLAWRLFNQSERQSVRRSWATGFGALAFAAFTGGTFHGFAPYLGALFLAATWKVAVYCIGIFDAALLAGSVIATTRGTVRNALLSLVGLKLVVYAAWMTAHDEFSYVIIDSAAAMAGVLALHGWSAARHRDQASYWVLAGVAVSALAAAIQYSGFALHQHLNHNDLYHLIQIAAMTLFYKGGKLLRDFPS